MAGGPSAAPAATLPEDEGQEFYFVTAKALLESAHFERILTEPCKCRTEGSPCKCCSLGNQLAQDGEKGLEKLGD